MESIKEYLNKLDRLEPVPTEQKPAYYQDTSVKAVIFDIYGTLLISASGDIDETDIKAENVKLALKASHYQLIAGKIVNGRCSSCDAMLQAMKEGVRSSHLEQQAKGSHHPEVDILEIWRVAMNKAVENNWVMPGKDADLKSFTFIFELLSNRVYPMPGMKSIIQSLYSAQIPMGIVSNAQFYTPVIMNFLIDGNVEDKETITYFDADLTVYSYREKIAKPDHIITKLEQLNEITGL